MARCGCPWTWVMAMRVKPDTGELGLKQRYRATQGWECDRVLVDKAHLMIKASFQLPYPVKEGLIKWLMRLCYQDLRVPDLTVNYRRAGEPSVTIAPWPRRGPTRAVRDSTVLATFGEGGCEGRQRGVGERGAWRKVHLAVDETTRNNIDIEATPMASGDGDVLLGLVDRVEGEFPQVSVDGACASRRYHAVFAEQDLRAMILPLAAPLIWRDDHTRGTRSDEIQAQEPHVWKMVSGDPVAAWPRPT